MPLPDVKAITITRLTFINSLVSKRTFPWGISLTCANLDVRQVITVSDLICKIYHRPLPSLLEISSTVTFFEHVHIKYRVQFTTVQYVSCTVSGLYSYTMQYEKISQCDINIFYKPARILIAGFSGSGKSTFVVNLLRKYRSSFNKVFVLGADLENVQDLNIQRNDEFNPFIEKVRRVKFIDI